MPLNAHKAQEMILLRDDQLGAFLRWSREGRTPSTPLELAVCTDVLLIPWAYFMLWARRKSVSGHDLSLMLTHFEYIAADDRLLRARVANAQGV